jgi:hypothetical protein
MVAVKFCLLLCVVLAAACTSPEAGRQRGGEPGADPGNRDAIVEIHQGAEPYHDTPCRMTDMECPETTTSSDTKRDSAN